MMLELNPSILLPIEINHNWGVHFRFSSGITWVHFSEEEALLYSDSAPDNVPTGSMGDALGFNLSLTFAGLSRRISDSLIVYAEIGVIFRMAFGRWKTNLYRGSYTGEGWQPFLKIGASFE